jgi:hypothetical protein
VAEVVEAEGFDLGLFDGAVEGGAGEALAAAAVVEDAIGG